MAEAWKGAVVGQVNHFDGRRELTVLAGEDVPRLLVSDGPKRVVFTPIEDESLPHPGDGKIWETHAGNRVEILSAPVEGVVIVKGLAHRPGLATGYDIAALRERPRTRTVTVELDEDEIDAIRASALSKSPRYNAEFDAALKKLAAALEDE